MISTIITELNVVGLHLDIHDINDDIVDESNTDTNTIKKNDRNKCDVIFCKRRKFYGDSSILRLCSHLSHLLQSQSTLDVSTYV